MPGVEHTKVMEELEEEWKQNKAYHTQHRYEKCGIRSSQISALVALLMKKGVLKPEE